MDFSLSLADSFGLLTPAAQKNHILATNQEAWSSYGIQLTPDEAEMLVSSAKKSIKDEELVQFGDSIVPRLIHKFLPSGYLGTYYAQRIASLTEAFYQIKGDLQALYDASDDPECYLSDNALLDYMYQFYVSPSCCGDCAEMQTQMERIVVTGMRRLLEYRAAKRKKAAAAEGDPEMRALYADKLMQEEEESIYETEYEEQTYDYMYREALHKDVFGNYVRDYDWDYAEHARGSYAEELSEVLMRDPELLLPSPQQEAEWEAQAEAWEAEDEAANGKEQKAWNN